MSLSTSEQIIKAIQKINPDAKVIVGDSLDKITWVDGTTPIARADIEAQMPSDLELALEPVRVQRNYLLLNCDWTDLPHSALTDEKKTEWQNYRTQLRNITDGITTVEQAENITWPTKPGA